MLLQKAASGARGKNPGPSLWGRWRALGLGCLAVALPLCGQSQAAAGKPVDPVAILAEIGRGNRQAPAGALEGINFAPRSEYSLQVTGLLAVRAGGAPTSHISSQSVGFLLGLREYLNRWEGLEVELGFTRNGGAYFSPSTAPRATGVSLAPNSANVLRLNFNEVITAGTGSHVQPFLVGGGGVAAFQLQNRTALAPRSQVRPIGVLGAGVNVRFVHTGFRAEIEGIFYKTPDFHNPSLASQWTHVVQPSVGLIFSF